MTTELVTKKTMEIVNISEKVLDDYVKAFITKARLTDNERKQFIGVAQAFGLNPFKREIHISKYGNQDMSIIVGYEVYLKRAEETGLLDHWKAYTKGSIKGGDLKGVVEIKRKDRNELFVWECDYSEFVGLTKEGRVTKFWKKANFMIKKVAIGQGFRLCFPIETGGMPYTKEEIPTTNAIEVPGNIIPDAPLKDEVPKFEPPKQPAKPRAKAKPKTSVPKETKVEPPKETKAAPKSYAEQVDNPINPPAPPTPPVTDPTQPIISAESKPPVDEPKASDNQVNYILEMGKKIDLSADGINTFCFEQYEKALPDLTSAEINDFYATLCNNYQGFGN